MKVFKLATIKQLSKALEKFIKDQFTIELRNKK